MVGACGEGGGGGGGSFGDVVDHWEDVVTHLEMRSIIGRSGRWGRRGDSFDRCGGSFGDVVENWEMWSIIGGMW